MGKLLPFLLKNAILQDLLRDLQINILYLSKKEDKIVNIVYKGLYYTNDPEQGIVYLKKIHPQIVILQLPLSEAYHFVHQVKDTISRIIVISEEKDGDAIIQLLSLGTRFLTISSTVPEAVYKQIHDSLYDLSLHKEVEKQKQLMRAILEFQEDMMFIIEDDEIIDCNTTFLEFIGLSHMHNYHKKLRLTSLLDYLVNEAGYYYSKNKTQWLEDCIRIPKKVKMKNKQGTEKVFLLRATTLPDDGTRFIVICTDVTQFELVEKDNDRFVIIDTLTNLYNRFKFETILTEYWSNIINERDIDFSIVFLDIDDFQFINSQYGQDVGDLILSQLADLITKHMEAKDIAARWNGDTFVLLLTGVSKKEAFQKAEKIRFFVETNEFSKDTKLTVSSGIAQYEKGITREVLIRRAELALEEAKKRGKNQVIIYKKEKI